MLGPSIAVLAGAVTIALGDHLLRDESDEPRSSPAPSASSPGVLQNSPTQPTSPGDYLVSPSPVLSPAQAAGHLGEDPLSPSPLLSGAKSSPAQAPFCTGSEEHPLSASPLLCGAKSSPPSPTRASDDGERELSPSPAQAGSSHAVAPEAASPGESASQDADSEASGRAPEWSPTEEFPEDKKVPAGSKRSLAEAGLGLHVQRP